MQQMGPGRTAPTVAGLLASSMVSPALDAALLRWNFVVAAMLELPYVASCKIGTETLNNLPVLEMNNHTIKVRLPDGNVIKRSFRKHNPQITFLSPDLKPEGSIR